MADDNGWETYKKLIEYQHQQVIDRLDKGEERWEKFLEQTTAMQSDIASLKEQVKTMAKIWGAATGFLAGLPSLIVSFIKK